MKRSLLVTLCAALTSGSLSAVVLAQPLEEVTVQAKRIMSTKVVERSSSGIPILDITISYGVSTAGLDLASHTGFEEMQKRVNSAARAACEEISRQYPDASPDERTCAKEAAAKAMSQVHKLAHAGPTNPAG
jgi:UrcA family protein